MSWSEKGREALRNCCTTEGCYRGPDTTLYYCQLLQQPSCEHGQGNRVSCSPRLVSGLGWVELYGTGMEREFTIK